MKAQILTLVSLLSITQQVLAINYTDVLHFAYELTRHGARSPSQSQNYTVGPNMLTPQGMRQRYLLGAQNRQRYTEQYTLIDLSQDL